VIDPDTELNNELCDEVCAELQYLQWKLAQTMGINELKTMPLVRQYKKSHHHEMELDERSQSHRESIDELSAQVLAVQDFKAKELLKKDQEERQKLAKVREREDAFVVLLHSLYCCARCTAALVVLLHSLYRCTRCTAALVVLTRFRHDSPTDPSPGAATAKNGGSESCSKGKRNPSRIEKGRKIETEIIHWL